MSLRKVSIQDGRKKYYTKRYINANRWTTYSEIIKLVLEIEPTNILEIGFGNRLVADILKKIGFSIKVMDNDKTLKPDLIMDVRDDSLLKFKNEFDLVIASQILEHIPYTDYLNVLKNISYISKSLIITLPYCSNHSLYISARLNIHLFGRYRLIINKGYKTYKKKLSNNHNPKHRWEIGTQGFPLRKIKKDIKKQGWEIFKNYFNNYYPYHYIFFLKSIK